MRQTRVLPTGEAHSNAPRMQCCSRTWVERDRLASNEEIQRVLVLPEIASISPRSVGTTFYSSHTMMEAQKRGGLIASSEARIVESRQASNRLSRETQSATRRRIGRPQTNRQTRRCGDERFGRSSMSPATTGGWTTSSTTVPQTRDVDLTSESLASGVRDPAFGEDEQGGARRLSKAAPGNSPRRVVMSNAARLRLG